MLAAYHQKVYSIHLRCFINLKKILISQVLKFYSTNNKNSRVSFKEALMIGMPLDNGLFMPEYIPDHTNLIKGINELSIHDISYIIGTGIADRRPGGVCHFRCSISTIKYSDPFLRPLGFISPVSYSWVPLHGLNLLYNWHWSPI